MRVIVAGATGAIGAPLARTLVDHGHEVIGITRRWLLQLPDSPISAPGLSWPTCWIRSP